MKAQKLLEEVEKEVQIALNRVLTAEIGHGKRPDWQEFERNLAFLTDYLRIRHAGKHAVALEALYDFPTARFELADDEFNRIAAYVGKRPDEIRACFEAIRRERVG